MTTIETRVAAGIGWLNTYADPGWLDLIDLDDLDLGSPSVCVIGQVFGGYSKTTDRFGLTRRDQENLGFELGCALRTSYGYEELTEAWKIELQKLKES